MGMKGEDTRELKTGILKLRLLNWKGELIRPSMS